MDIFAETLFCYGVEWIDHFTTLDTENLVYENKNRAYRIIQTETMYELLEDDMSILQTSSVEHIRRFLIADPI